eukprot:CAMPEP_0182906824 /NCGR_PEP_ID=MMETSP0034_2-20130328/34042_1 /TAXON_ID=156128 /ORGANISM="Nephroselmis pyriformis, Strain CCMP717" /LENGTH=233 /DNA_ID=CAMNT_0025042607 /DNA_START=243 /DNA_END=941 /DNA_ORIENTATION=+
MRRRAGDLDFKGGVSMADLVKDVRNRRGSIEVPRGDMSLLVAQTDELVAGGGKSLLRSKSVHLERVVNSGEDGVEDAVKKMLNNWRLDTWDLQPLFDKWRNWAKMMGMLRQDAANAAAIRDVLQQTPQERSDEETTRMVAYLDTLGVKFFRDKNQAMKKELCRHLRLGVYEEGDVVFCQDLPGETFFVVLYGYCGVYQDEEKAPGAHHIEAAPGFIFPPKPFWESADDRKKRI